MNPVRISVLGLLLLIGATAIGMAAIVSPTAELANGLFTIVGGSLLFALLAIIYRNGNRRAFWLGFCVFGSAYLLACYGPFVGSTFRARLLTTTLIDRLYARMNPTLEDKLHEVASSSEGGLRFQWHIRFDQETDPDADSVALTAVGNRPASQVFIGFYPPASCSNLVWFRKSAHSIVTLWVAFVGGLVGRRLESTSRTSENSNPPDSPA